MGTMEFIKTKELYAKAIACACPMTYEEWLNLPDGYKAAALYINFFSDITSAWYKAQAEYIDEEEGISILMQYLLKNVPILKDEPKKFTHAYIYRVAYNSMGALRRAIYRQDEYNNTVAQYQPANLNDGTKEVDMFDYISDDTDVTTAAEVEAAVSGIMNIYLNANKATQCVISHIVNGSKLSASTKKKEAAIMESLREQLAPYKDAYIPSDDTAYFSAVIENEAMIESATVRMRDGVEAVYLGEKRVSQETGKMEVVFFGPKTDYILPIELAKTLEVTDIEYID